MNSSTTKRSSSRSNAMSASDKSKKATASKPPTPTDKEKILTDELEALTKELEESKLRVTKLREDGKWLNQEAGRVRTENQEYRAYMTKKTRRRQDAVISLTDLHTQEVQSINEARENIHQEFKIKKQNLLDVLLKKEHELSKIIKETEELQYVKDIMKGQDMKIEELQQQIVTASKRHSSAVQQLKEDYVVEKKKVEAHSKLKIAEMAKKADQEADSSLAAQSEKIRQENREMRRELMQLIEKTELLFEEKRRLDKQRKQLVIETRQAADLIQLNPDLKHATHKTS